MGFLDTLMTVRQTAQNHHKIEEFLDHLREAQAKRPPRPVSTRQKAQQTGFAMKLVGTMKEATFDPPAMGLIAIGGIKDDVQRKLGEIIKDLEDRLSKTKSIGMRNAIRLTLRDMYKQSGNDKKVLEHLHAMVAENDNACEVGSTTGDYSPGGFLNRSVAK